MAPSRCRLICFVLVLSILISLVPVGIMSAAADDVKLGKTTIDKVNIRVSPSSSAKLLFQIPKAGYVGTIKGETTAEKIHWYKVEFQSPDKGNDNYYTGYVNGNYFTPLTDAEAAVYKANMTVATPTPIPPDGSTATPTPVPQSNYASSDAPAGTTGTVTSSGTNLRAGPGKNFNSITQLNRGEVVTVLSIPAVESDQTFYRVRYGSTEGWIMSTYLKLNGDTAITPSPITTPTPLPAPSGDVVGYVTTTKGGVKLRQTPGGTTITTVSRNRTFPYLVQPVSKNGYTWYFVQADSYRGYLRGDCVKVVSGSGTATATPTGGAVVTATPTPGPTAAPASVTGYIQTIKGGVNLRKDAAGTIFASVAKNKTYPYMQTKTVNKYTWYYAQTEFGYGWLRSDCVKVVSAPAPTETPAGMTPTPTPVATATPTPTPTSGIKGYVKTTASGVNLRKKAGYSDVIVQLQKGTVLPYYDTTVADKVTWYHVYSSTYGFGYLHASYVTETDDKGTAVTPTPAPTGSTTPAPTSTPDGGSQTEASYNTLRLGSSGNAVKNLVTELKNQGYYKGDIVSKYNSSVESAVKAFQRDKGLTVDGIAGPATQHKLYGTVPVGAADTSNLTMTLYPAEKIDWYTGGIDELWARGSNYKIYDVKTGIIWWAHRWAGGNHADIEPLTAADTARLCKAYGVTTAKEIKDKDLYERRPCLVTIGTRTFACSLYGVPHNYPKGDTIPDNAYDGQACLHFTNSRTSDSNKLDSGHQAAIEYAWQNAPNGHK